MRKVAILGVAMTKFGISEKTNLEMFAEAGLEAITRSNLEPKDMEALYFGNCLGDFEEGQLHMAPFAHAELGLPISAPATRFESACATATVAIRHAALLVGAGVYDIVLAGGTERATKMGTPLATRTFAMASEAHQDVTTAAILQIVGNLRAEAVQVVADDGVSQQVTTKAGVARVENVTVPNPVGLRPYRTFQEIEQPASQYVLRMRREGGNGLPSIALHEVLDDQWRFKAVQQIKKFLESIVSPADVTIFM